MNRFRLLLHRPTAHRCGRPVVIALLVLGVMGLLRADALAETEEDTGHYDLPGKAGGAVRLFIFSGQSNMVHVDPNDPFLTIVRQAFPDDRLVTAKWAGSGKLIRMWSKDWQLPEDAPRRGQGRNGKIYDKLMANVRAATEGLPRPDSITFLWMQGEAETKTAAYGPIYGDALQDILDQLREDLGYEDIDMVVGRISDYGIDKPEERPSWNTIREQQVRFAEADPEHRAWVNTDDLNGDHNGLHYPPKGYEGIGRRFAEKAIELIRGDR